MITNKNASPYSGLPVRRERLDKSSSLAVIHDSTAYVAVLLPASGLATVAEQTQDVIDRIDAVLEQCGTSKRRLLRATIFYTDVRHIDEINTRWDAWVPWHDPPACTYIEAKLQTSRHKVAIQVICGV